MAIPPLILENLVIGFPGRPLSSPLNLELPEGASLGILGGNGAGKTTLVRTLMGLLPPLGGQVHWKQGTSFGYVPQENLIDLHFPLRVSDLLKMGMFPDLPRFRKTTPSLQETARTVLEEMEVAHLQKALFRDLSGGERQRALLARAWISKPRVLIMDEPFNSLDYRFKEKLWKIFFSWKTQHELNLLIIDHDLNRIINQVQWVIVLGPKGTLAGPISQVLTPENLSKAYGAPLHIHEENGHLQVHFL